MQLQLKHLSVCIFTIMLTACGGGGNSGGSEPSGDNTIGAGSTENPAPPVAEKYPEPTKIN